MNLSLPCWEQSLEAGEPIAGSAIADIDVWLLLEYRERWEPNIADCALPGEVAALLDKVRKEHPEVRIQFIRKPDVDSGPLTMFVATTGMLRGVHKLMLHEYEELLDLDLEAMLTGDVTSPANARALYLVCTHGKRDRCCARRGVAFYRSLSEQKHDADVWQSSHLGGHRFAATCVYLPFGIQYGRLEPKDATAMVQAHAREELLSLEHYRGMTHLSRPAQTIEAWLREQHVIASIDGLRPIDEEVVDDERHAARFRTRDGIKHRVMVRPHRGEIPRKMSCAADEAELPTWFNVIRHEAATPPPPKVKKKL